MKEYYTDKAILAAAEKSMSILRAVVKEIPIVLIGGMAVKKYADAPKSHDPDIVVDATGLALLKQKFRVDVNSRLQKFEIKVANGSDIDVYLVGMSRLEGVDLKDAFMRSVKTADGFRVVAYEDLIRLKTAVFARRKDTRKGAKDAADLVALLRDRPEKCLIPPENRAVLRYLLSTEGRVYTATLCDRMDIQKAKRWSQHLLPDTAPYHEPPLQEIAYG